MNKESREVIGEFIFRIINESIAKKNFGASTTSVCKASSELEQEVNSPRVSPPPPKDLISLILNSKVNETDNLKGKAFDSEMHLIRDTVVNFIFDRKNTTSHSISFFLVMLNRYPKVLKKIREELQKKLPRSPSDEL